VAHLERSAKKFMKAGFLIALFAISTAFATAAEEWIRLFNGKDLAGWKANDSSPERFTVADGMLKTSGGPAHLFFVGTDGKASFRNFELKAKVMTTPNSNSGIFFHTQFQAEGFPKQGFEAQINASEKDRKKTGSLHSILNILDDPPHKDGEWFDYAIKVEGRRIILQVNGRTMVDWTQPPDWNPEVTMKKYYPGRRIGDGTIAIQAHDPQSVVFFKDIFVRQLP
jgi:hypothetical protein